MLLLCLQSLQVHGSSLEGEDVYVSDAVRVATSDVDFLVSDDVLATNCSSSLADKGRAAERVFLAGIRKHAEITNDIENAFASYGL